MYEVTDRTRGVVRRSSDGILVGCLLMLWLGWGYVVTLTRLIDTLPGFPTLPVPRASAFAGDTNAATS